MNRQGGGRLWPAVRHWGWPLGLGAVTLMGVLAMATSCGVQAQVQPGAGADRTTLPRVYRFERAAVVDAMGQREPVPAGTMFVPYGWRTSGGIEWGTQHACTDYFAINWSATAPDGRSKLAWLPAFRWEQNSTGNPQPLKIGCTMQPFTDAKGFLTVVARRLWPGARVLDYRPRRDLAAVKSPTTRPTPGGGQTTVASDAGELLFAFEERGVPMRGLLVTSVDFERTQLPTPGVGVLQFLNAQAGATFAVTVPDGQLDFAFYEALRASFRGDPAWIKVISDHINKVISIDINGASERQRIWQNTAAQVNQIITQGWQGRQQSGDRSALEFSQTIRGVQTYIEPGGKRIELPGGQASAWKLDDGSYLLSTQSAFDPRRDLGLNAQKLEPQQ